MRNLTIRRNKSFVGSTAKMQVYLEDAGNPELTIADTPCRKLGTLKNGEEQTYEIGEEPAKVFVIADKLSKDYCNDCYELPAGQADISLSGECKFQPQVGNAFMFDGNTSETAASNRKKNKRTGLIVLIAALCVGIVVGVLCTVLSGSAPAKAKEKAFSDEGLHIVLTDEFYEMDMEDYGYSICYGSPKAGVFVIKEDKALVEAAAGEISLFEYAQLVATSNLENGREVSAVLKKDDLTYFVYDFTNEEEHKAYRYFTFTYEADDAFWIVQFSTPKENADAMQDDIMKWAKSVTFD